MAREDTKWFIVGVVALSLVLFLALPLTLLVVVDDLKLRAEIRHEIKQSKRLRAELERKSKDERPVDDVAEQAKREVDR